MSKLKMKEETKEHTEAFEIYYSMGQNRTLRKLGKKLKRSLQTINKWSTSFDWQKRVKDRDKQISQKLAQRNISSILDTKKRLITFWNRIIEKAEKKNTIEAKDVSDLSTATKMVQLLTGGATERFGRELSVEEKLKRAKELGIPIPKELKNG